MARALERMSAMGDTEIIKAGWLSKRGDRNKAIKRRWCVVRDGSLDYYENQQQPAASGSIPLKGSLVEKSDKENAHLQCFFFITPAKPADVKSAQNVDRTYVFCAETSSEVVEWLNVFEDCNANVIRSVKEGVMNKSDSKGKNWTRRYFVLFEDRLLYYADPKDRQPKGCVPLLHANIIVEEAYGEKNFMFEIKGVTAEAEEGGRTFTLSCFNEDDRRDWIRTIQRLIIAKTAPKSPNCTREGWLYLAHKHSWLHRYFVLLNGKLDYYRHKMDDVAEGTIDLTLGARMQKTEEGKARGLLTAVGGISSQTNLFAAKSELRMEGVISLAETYDSIARVYQLSSTRREDVDQWATSLGQVISQNSGKGKGSTYPGSLLEGYLNKCNAAMNRWNHRYFVLFEDKVLYFKNKGDHLLSPAGEILLPSGFEMSLEPEVSNPDYEQVKSLNMANLMSVCSSGDEGERRLYMQAKDLTERNAWMSALTLLWKKKLHRVNPSSLRECYVCTQGRTGLGKPKRYLVLLPDKLCLFKKRMDDVAEKEIALVPGTCLERDSGPSAKDGNGVEVNLDRRLICTEYGDDSGRRTMLEFSETETREDWMNALNGLGFMSSKIKPGSLKEGYGKKMGAKRKAWKQRYFVLSDKAITYYVKLRDTEAAGMIDLTEGTKITMELPVEEHCLSVDNGSARVFRLQFGDAQTLQSWFGAIDTALKALKSGKLFGGSLEDHVKVSPYGVPKICFDLIESLKKTALSLEGIFRVPGNNDLIQAGVSAFEEDYRLATEGKMNTESPVASYNDPHSVAGILKLYYRKLRTPLIPFDMYSKFAAFDDLRADKKQSFASLAALIKELPPTNRNLLAYQLDLLQLVAEHSAENKMGAKNCAMVFAPGLMRKPEEQQATDPQLLVKELEVSQNVLTLLVEGFASIFPQGYLDPRSKNGASQTIKFVAAKPRAAGVPPLPPDWQEHKNQDGIPFYYNTVTKESVWIRPVAPEETERPSFDARPGFGGPSKPFRPKEDASKSAVIKDTPPAVPAFGGGNSAESERLQVEAGKAKAASAAAWADVAALTPANDPTWQEIHNSVEQQKSVVLRAQEQLAALQARLDARAKELQVAHDAAALNAERLTKLANASAAAAGNPRASTIRPKP